MDIGQIFAWEDYLSKLDEAERYQRRLEKQKPLMEKFFKWLEGIVVSENLLLVEQENMPLAKKNIF